MNEKTIDVILITGFLGAGKTTLMKHLLSSEDSSRTGILVNEYARPDVDGRELNDLAEYSRTLTNGSIFCACLRDSFEKTLYQFLDMPVDRLFIEASGMADPFSMNEFIGGMRTENGRSFRFRGSICVVDACNFPQLREQLISPTNQLKKSSLVLLNKTDLVDETRMEIIRRKILETVPEAKIISTSHGRVDIKEVFGLLQGEPENVSDTTNSCSARPYSAVLNLIRPVDEEKLLDFIRDISEKFIRTKGYFKNTDGVRRFESSVYDGIDVRDDEGSEPCRIVLISMEYENLRDYLSVAWKKRFSGLMLLEEE